jgi:hypothetical protein
MRSAFVSRNRLTQREGFEPSVREYRTPDFESPGKAIRINTLALNRLRNRS